MEPQLKSYMVVSHTEAVAKRLGRQCAYEEGFIRTQINKVSELPPSPHTPMLNLPGGLRAWRVDILVRERRATPGSSDIYDLWRFPNGALVEATAPGVFVARGTSTPVPIGTRGKVIGRKFNFLRVKLDGAAHETPLSPGDVKMIASATRS